jgi:hypothetical protein
VSSEGLLQWPRHLPATGATSKRSASIPPPAAPGS